MQILTLSLEKGYAIFFMHLLCMILFHLDYKFPTISGLVGDSVYLLGYVCTSGIMYVYQDMLDQVYLAASCNRCISMSFLDMLDMLLLWLDPWVGGQSIIWRGLGKYR